MRLLRIVLLVLALLLLSATAVSAQGRRGFGRGGGHGFGSGFGSYRGYSPAFAGPIYSPGPLDYGFGYGSGYPYYPAHYPPYPYPAALPQEPQYRVVIAEATHDWRYWSPTTKIITGPVDAALIGMGRPAEPPPEPLGDVARRYRAEAASRPRAVWRIWNTQPIVVQR